MTRFRVAVLSLNAAVLSLIAAVGQPSVTHAQATDIYWTFAGDVIEDCGVNRSNLAGTAIMTDVVPDIAPTGIAINPIAGTMYLANGFVGANITVCTTAGVCTVAVTSAGDFIGDIDIDLTNGHIYWTDWDTWTIRRAPIGVVSAVGTIVRDTEVQPFGLFIDQVNGYIYWSGPFSGSGGIERARLDGVGGIERILTTSSSGGAASARGIAVDPARNLVYFTDDANDAIYRLDLSMPDGFGEYVYTLIMEGGTPGLVDMAFPFDIELDPTANQLYWTATTGVWRANADGTAPVELITGPFVDDELHTGLALSFPIKEDGEPCTTPDTCLHGLCVDGVCCATTCPGYCMSCNGDETGMASGTCQPATFVANTEPLCSDLNPCTDEFCTTGGGCTMTPRVGGCDDGNACTLDDMCVDGLCVPGTVECDAGPPDAGRDGGVVPLRDGGRRDAGVRQDGAALDGSLDGGPGGGGGCGCRAASNSPVGIGSTLLLGLAVFGWRRRRGAR